MFGHIRQVLPEPLLCATHRPFLGFLILRSRRFFGLRDFIDDERSFFWRSLLRSIMDWIVVFRRELSVSSLLIDDFCGASCCASSVLESSRRSPSVHSSGLHDATDFSCRNNFLHLCNLQDECGKKSRRTRRRWRRRGSRLIKLGVYTGAAIPITLAKETRRCATRKLLRLGFQFGAACLSFS